LFGPVQTKQSPATITIPLLPLPPTAATRAQESAKDGEKDLVTWDRTGRQPDGDEMNQSKCRAESAAKSLNPFSPDGTEQNGTEL